MPNYAVDDDTDDSVSPLEESSSEDDVPTSSPVTRMTLTSGVDTRRSASPSSAHNRKHRSQGRNSASSESVSPSRSGTRDTILTGTSLFSLAEHVRKSQPKRQDADAKTPSQGTGEDKMQTESQTLRPQSKLAAERIPDWGHPAISYQIWCDIMFYAASIKSASTPDSNWLLNASRTCKALLEPALSTLYYCPPLRTAPRVRRLIALLALDPSQTLINYPAKIELLHISVEVVPQTVLFQLIHPLPRLKELIFYTPLDQPPYRELTRTVRWSYPADLIRALEPTVSCETAQTWNKSFPTILKSWEWSSRLLGGSVPRIKDITLTHQLPSFSQLTRLSFINFQVPSLNQMVPEDDDLEELQRQEDEDTKVIHEIAEAISQLQCLKQLCFESSTVMNHRMLTLLPRDLLQLDLINCWEIKSEDLAQFLESHGRHLRVLSLLHNQSLNLAYLKDLGIICPGLRELHMNLSYFRHHVFVNDGDPMYDQALTPDIIPTWPATLRVIDFEHIRDWSVETAEMFFQSLIDQAGSLPDLRYLAIKTILNIPWQTRASMRKEWTEKMESTFLRRRQPPAAHTARPNNEEILYAQNNSNSPPSRRSGRLVDQDSIRSHRGCDSECEGDTTPVHSLCNTVSITFDNQKLTEIQYGMEDFEDGKGEDNSEDEWNGDYDDDEDFMAF